MVKRSRFGDYSHRYERWCWLEKDEDGVLLLQLHTAGGPFVLDYRSHDVLADVFADIAGDRELTTVILTGTGDTFMDRWGVLDKGRTLPAHTDAGADALEETGWVGTQLHLNLLAIQVPVIAAVNGPCSIHPELPLMCDIVLAAEHASLRDGAHFARGVVPGDGVHTVLPIVMGHNRARHFLLTGQTLTAVEAKGIGAINEVLPAEGLLDRAFELARYMSMRPPLTLRLTRSILNQRLRRAATADLAFGVVQETFAMRNFLSWRGEQAELDRSWDDDPWG